jgi:hypothetical protein
MSSKNSPRKHRVLSCSVQVQDVTGRAAGVSSTVQLETDVQQQFYSNTVLRTCWNHSNLWLCANYIVFPCVSTDFKTILALRLSLYMLVSICTCQPCQRCLFRLEMSDFGVLRHQTATFSYFQLLTYSYLLHALSLLRLLSFLHAIILSYFVDLVGRPGWPEVRASRPSRKNAVDTEANTDSHLFRWQNRVAPGGIHV